MTCTARGTGCRLITTPDLPEVLALVARRCSETAALRLAYHFGGMEIYIPDRRRLVPGHPLVETLGADLAGALHEIFGRGALAIPLGPVRQSSSGRCEVPAHLSATSAAEAARALGVHIRTIQRARARARVRAK